MPGGSGAGFTSKGWSNSSAVSPNACPALKAARLASRTCGLLENFASIHLIVSAVGRVYIHDTSPRAKQFFERSASRGFTPSGSTAPEREARHRHLEHRVAVEAAVLQRVGVVAGLGEVALLEGVLVDDHGAAGLEARELVAQRGGVHGDEHVRGVAGRGDLVVGDVHLEGRHPGEGAGRSADLGREVRQRGEVVPEQRAGAGEAVAGELHAVAGVAGEADDDPVEALGCESPVDASPVRSAVSDNWPTPRVTVRRAVATGRSRLRPYRQAGRRAMRTPAT